MSGVDAYLEGAASLDAGRLALLVLVVSLCSAGLLVRMGLDATGPARRAWVAIGVSCLIWGVAMAGQLLGTPSWVYWGPARLLSLGTVVIGILAFPGVSRPMRDWPPVALDGWMVAGGAFTISWMILRSPDLASRGHVHVWLIGWLIAGELVISTLGGLVARAAQEGRRAVGYVLVAGLFLVTGDQIWILTGNVQAGIVLWLVAIALCGVIPLIGSSDMFSSTFVDGDGVREIRLSQMPVLPAAFFLFGPVDATVAQAVAAASVLVVCFGNVIVQSRQNRRLLEVVSQQSHRYEALLSDSGDGILQLDTAGGVVFANDAAARVLGHDVTDMTGRSLQEYVHPEDLADAVRGARQLLSGDSDAVRLQLRVRHGSGSYRYVESTVSRSGDAQGYVCSARDVTDRVQLRLELVRQARLDALTGLLNRSAFLELLQDTLDAGRAAAVLFVDLDDFTTVNDTLGHAAGDELLRRVSTLLRQVTDPADVVARLGGDEFAVLTAGRATPATATARTVIGALGSVSASPAATRPASASIGIALGTGGSAVDLLRDADLAMHRSKNAGGGGVAIFEPWMKDHVIERSRTLSRLESAIASDGLHLELQPVVDLGTGGWEGFEALVRWRDGDVRHAPDEFIPLAEESGLVVPLGLWVLGEALRQIATWSDPLAGVAVNVSPRQLESDDFAAAVFAELTRTGVSPERLTLEITEQAAVTDLSRTASRLGPLRRRGVHISVDDFGTGFSSMRYLTRLPVDALKIDQQFVGALGASPEDDVLVASMIRLAADLGLDVVAEGVETTGQAQALRDLGCRLAQGYLYSRPRPLEDLRREAPDTPALRAAAHHRLLTPAYLPAPAHPPVPAMRDGGSSVQV